MKKVFSEPVLCVHRFDLNDIIATSGSLGGHEDEVDEEAAPSRGVFGASF